MIDKLPPRERQVFEALLSLGTATAAEIVEAVPEPRPSNAAVRVMLSRLERKGFVARSQEGHRFIYFISLPEPKIRQSALRQFVRTFFGGSPLGAAAALIGMSDKVDPAELVEVVRLLAVARKERCL
jgi:predicted transcriptional regulator